MFALLGPNGAGKSTTVEILRAVEAGAASYLLKDTPRSDLVEAVRAASRGETVLAPAVAARLVRHLREDRDALTRREVEVLREVATGAPNAQVAAALHIGEATVKTHLLHVFTKLGVDGRTAAVTRAMELAILPPPTTRRHRTAGTTAGRPGGPVPSSAWSGSSSPCSPCSCSARRCCASPP